MAKPAPIGVGIIGVTPGSSWAAIAHVPALRALPEFEIVALSTSKPETAKVAGEAFGVAAAFGDYRELLAHPGVDLVTVTVRVPHHAALVTAALDAGKMVYCEWPLGNGLDEAVAMAAQARRAGVRTVVGLQARVAPAVLYMHDLIRDGYVGEVLSTTMLGTGRAWGAAIDRKNVYVFDRRNGATLLSIPTGHALDALCYVLGEFATLSANLIQRRRTVLVDGAEEWPVTAPDQVMLDGILRSGTATAVHYRGGTSLGTNFLWEINGSAGDLRVTAPEGHAQMAALALEGGQGAGPLRALDVPERYRWVPAALTGPAVNVAQTYARFARDLREGTHLSADFDHAVLRHRLLAAIEDAAAAGRLVTA